MADEAADGLSCGAADEHTGGEYRLGAGAVGLRIAARDHRLRRGGVCGFSDADEGAGEQQHREGMDVAGGDGSEAPENDAAGDDAAAVEAIGEEAEGDAGEGEDGLQRDLQIADLSGGESEFVADQRDERGDGLSVGEIHEIDEREDGEKAKLVGRERERFEFERHGG